MILFGSKARAPPVSPAVYRNVSFSLVDTFKYCIERTLDGAEQCFLSKSTHLTNHSVLMQTDNSVILEYALPDSNHSRVGFAIFDVNSTKTCSELAVDWTDEDSSEASSVALSWTGSGFLFALVLLSF